MKIIPRVTWTILSFVTFSGILSAASSGKPPVLQPPPQGQSKEIQIDRSPIAVGRYWRAKAENAKFVFEGTVTSVTYGEMKNADSSVLPITYVTFKVEKFFKGKFDGPELTIAYVFGTILNGERILSYEGNPILAEKDHLFVFLNKNGDKLSPLGDEDFLFSHQGEIYTNESNRIIASKENELYLGHSEEIDEILNRDIKIKGVNYRYEVSKLPESDESGLEPVSNEKFRELLTSYIKPSEEAFVTSKIGSFAKSDYAGSPAVNPKN